MLSNAEENMIRENKDIKKIKMEVLWIIYIISETKNTLVENNLYAE